MCQIKKRKLARERSPNPDTFLATTQLTKQSLKLNVELQIAA